MLGEDPTPEDPIVRELMMVLAARLSFDSKRYLCYHDREEQSTLGPHGASRRMALSLAQFPAVGLSPVIPQYTTAGLRFQFTS